jgi:hypothetical protein
MTTGIEDFETFIARLGQEVSLLRDEHHKARFSKILADAESRIAPALSEAKQAEIAFNLSANAAADLMARNEEASCIAAAAEDERRAQVAQAEAERSAKARGAEAMLSAECNKCAQEFERAVAGLEALKTELRPTADDLFQTVLSEAESRGKKVDGTLKRRIA